MAECSPKKKINPKAWGVTFITQEAFGFFDAEESQLHFTWKELLAVTRALGNQAPLLQSQQVLLITDYQVFCSIVYKGISKSLQLMKEYRAIFPLLCKFNIRLQTQYLHTSLNVSRFSISSGFITLRVGSIGSSVQPAGYALRTTRRRLFRFHLDGEASILQ